MKRVEEMADLPRKWNMKRFCRVNLTLSDFCYGAEARCRPRKTRGGHAARDASDVTRGDATGMAWQSREVHFWSPSVLSESSPVRHDRAFNSLAFTTRSRVSVSEWGMPLLGHYLSVFPGLRCLFFSFFLSFFFLFLWLTRATDGVRLGHLSYHCQARCCLTLSGKVTKKRHY